MNKIALVSVNSPAYQVMADITWPTKVAYCERHGYDPHHWLFHGEHKDASWQKVGAVGNLLARGYETVMWMDCDVAVMNPTIKIEDIIEYNEVENIALTTDHNGLNTGCFIARNTEMTQQFLYVIGAEGYAIFKDHKWQEQEAMKYFLMGEPYKYFPTFVPQKQFNSMLNSETGIPSFVQGQYTPGDMVIHFGGMSMENRLKFLRKYVV